MKLYCITSGSDVFEVWCDDPVMCTFRKNKAADTLDRHPEILKRLPKNLSEGYPFTDGLFLSEEAAWDAFLNSGYIDREKWEKTHGSKLTKDSYLEASGDSGRKCLCIDVPEVRDVTLKNVDNQSCANCAFDFYTEGDGYERHGCPLCADACGRSTQRCKHWTKWGSR